MVTSLTNSGDSSPTWVVVNQISAQFEAVRHLDVIATLEYEQHGAHFDLIQTFVLVTHRQQGVGRHLVLAALDAIRDGGGTATPTCRFVFSVAAADRSYSSILQVNPDAAHRPRTGRRANQAHGRHRFWWRNR